MKRCGRIIVILFIFTAVLVGCDQSEPVAAPAPSNIEAPSAKPSEELSDLQNEIISLKQQLKEKDEQIEKLQETVNSTLSVVDHLSILQEKEASLFQAAKSVSKQNFPILLDYGDPVRKEILSSIDYDSLDISDNELLLYAALGIEGEEIDISQPVQVSLLDYINDESTEAISFSKELSLTLEHQNGKWVVTFSPRAFK
ncbi:hypothetical protein H8B09_00585 [Paenibacillus sp. PR3]|uniref:Lipoprotein n=1 Tax=Paenibacillus terricola TaxID=2763503 RepID=A0ABR8MMJ5_9BACL|nr:hypothetical protein [Paenibacillus terricola]MBD3917233.1 hypothetical protein [Paenibacillus terricola]